MIQGSKNKGDWSEAYVLLYLLGRRELRDANSALSFPIRKIIRHDSEDHKIDFVMTGADDVSISLNSELRTVIPSERFRRTSGTLYRAIIDDLNPYGLSVAESLLDEIGLNRLSSPHSGVVNLRIEFEAILPTTNSELGFSIISYIGGRPTLLNASNATNFVFEIFGIDEAQMNDINSIEGNNKIRERLDAIFGYGGALIYSGLENTVFSENLMMFDTQMDKILASALLYSFEYNESDCVAIINYLESENPLSYPRKGLYTYKFKRFLYAKAIGMEPSKVWDGEEDLCSGHIVAKADGDVCAFFCSKTQRFQQYLLQNSRFERASTNRHNYARIYRVGNRMYINLNMQIRFK